MDNIYGKPGYEEITLQLKEKLKELRVELNEEDQDYPFIQAIIDENWDK